MSPTSETPSPQQQPASADEAVPKELQDRVGALKALVSLHDLINQGTFPGFNATRVADAITFVEALHKQMTDEAKKHPQSNLIPGLLGLEESK